MSQVQPPSSSTTENGPAFVYDEKTNQFEFPTVPGSSNGFTLQKLMILYLGAAKTARFVPSRQVFNILGRLRCLEQLLAEYNSYIRKQAFDDAYFRDYLKRRTLEHMSTIGLLVTSTNTAVEVAGLSELICCVEQVFAGDIAAFRQDIANQMVVFDGLAELYRPGTVIQGRTSIGGVTTGFRPVDMFFEERRSLMGTEKSFHLTLEFVASFGNHFAVIRVDEVLSGWTGTRTRPIRDQLYHPLQTQADLHRFIERGKVYRKYATGGSRFQSYAPGHFYTHGRTNGPSSLSKPVGALLTGGGRMVVDQARGAELGHFASQGGDEATHSMLQLATRYKRWNAEHRGSKDRAATDAMYLLDSVPDELCAVCWPALVSFSFTAKQWGHVLVDGVEEIRFNNAAFEQLVLAQDKKRLIRALVSFGGKDGFEDIIEGKSGGSIFLLHGPPGVGKTLTAEAIAEVLHRPLYYVTMGELGTTPEEMEQRLSDVLDLCAGWNALTLIDEADVFLETRATADVNRNAMVCVMLRLLEYHPGILFLTTNRVKEFDPAFESRVTLALRYDHLTPDARGCIWKNLIQRLAIEVAPNIDYAKLSSYVANGRQIKNAVRLAVALARNDNLPLSQALLDETIAVTTLGRSEMGKLGEF